MRGAVARALAEDLGPGDVTSAACIPADARARAAMVAKAGGVVAGLDVARLVFAAVDPALAWQPAAHDGDRVVPGQVVARVAGATRSILAAERVALNFVQRLSGVATLTRAFVDAVAGTGCRVLDTRKTTPGLRALERAAVRAGGGVNHRAGLHDMVLIKDNHVAAAGAAQRRSPRRPAGARRWPELEASGGVTLATVRALAATGVDYVSVGALTHSAPALDLSLELEPTAPGAA